VEGTEHWLPENAYIIRWICWKCALCCVIRQGQTVIQAYCVEILTKLGEVMHWKRLKFAPVIAFSFLTTISSLALFGSLMETYLLLDWNTHIIY